VTRPIGRRQRSFGGSAQRRQQGPLHWLLPRPGWARDCGLAHPIIVTDSRDPVDAQALRDACVGIARHWRFDPSIGFVDKLIPPCGGSTRPSS